MKTCNVVRAVIVGHGPSMRGKGLGDIIDGHDKIVRLKGSGPVIGTKDYGYRIHALCASTEIMGTFMKTPAEEYWAYPKKGTFDPSTVVNVLTRLEKPVLLPLYHCNYWNKRFREMGSCHPNVSTGMAAILISIHRWMPKEIVLAGFDTLLDPETSFDRNHDIPRSGHGEYPNHDWKKENELLTVLSNVYKVDIYAIDPENNSRHDILEVRLQKSRKGDAEVLHQSLAD